jgi:hypothetical protein
VTSLTRAIADMPYRMDPSALACVVKVRVPNRSAAAAAASAAAAGSANAEGDDNGDEGSYAAGPGPAKKPKKGPQDTWWSQLQMLPRVSAAVASNIVRAYPTMRSLMDAYRDPAVTDAAKEHLLDDVLDGGKRKATKLSREIWRFFTTRDPATIIGEA